MTTVIMKDLKGRAPGRGRPRNGYLVLDADCIERAYWPRVSAGRNGSAPGFVEKGEWRIAGGLDEPRHLAEATRIGRSRRGSCTERREFGSGRRLGSCMEAPARVATEVTDDCGETGLGGVRPCPDARIERWCPGPAFAGPPALKRCGKMRMGKIGEREPGECVARAAIAGRASDEIPGDP